MVATLHQAADSGYYVACMASQGQRGASYYSLGLEPDGRWWNPHALFAEEAGGNACPDGQAINPDAFEQLYQGFSPDGKTALTQNAGEAERSAGLDITFSADKSVSVLWTIGDQSTRERIEAIQESAVRAALTHVYDRHCAYTRRGKGGREVLPAGILGATFQHGENRENEPQLHTHVVIFNVAQARDDSKWRALHQKPWYYWLHAAGAVYRNALAHGLSARLGVAIERHGERGELFRIAGIPEELCENWSKRRHQVLAAAREFGFSPAGNGDRTQAAVLATRKAKQTAGDPVERRKDWQREVIAQGHTLSEVVKQVIRERRIWTAEERAARLQELIGECAGVPGELTVNEAIFRLPDVIRRVAELSSGDVNNAALEMLVERVLRNEAIVRMEARDLTPEAQAGMAHTAVWSTRGQLSQELEIGELAKTLSARQGVRIEAPAVDAALAEWAARAPISDEQEAAVRHVCAAGDISVVEGAAGSGKSVTLRPIADLHRQAGYRVIAASIAWRAALQTGADCEARPVALEKLLRSLAKGTMALDARTLLIVDEAGMMPVRSTHRLLDAVERSGARLVLVGDREQLQPIEAGPGLRLITDVVGSARVEEIRRQRADLEDLLVWRDGISPAEAGPRADFLGDAERAELEGLRPSFTGVAWQAAASRDLKDRNAAAAIEAYVQRGRFHLCGSHDETLDRLVTDWMEHRRERPEETRIALARTNREVAELSSRLRTAVMAERRAAGETIESVGVKVAPAEGRSGGRELEVAPGDLLRIGATCWSHGLFNGSIVEVSTVQQVADAETGDERVRIEARVVGGHAVPGSRDRVAFFADEIRDWYGRVRLEHGYAVTIASAQGSTANRAFLWTDDRPARETIYPASTRHRDRLDWYLNRRLLAITVAESRPEDVRESPVTDGEIHGWLAQRWSREGPKEAALDHATERQRSELEGTLRAEREAEERKRFRRWLGGPAGADSTVEGDLHPALRLASRYRSVFTRPQLESALRRLGTPEPRIAEEAETLLADGRVMPLYGPDPGEARQPVYTTVAVWAEERALAGAAERLGATQSVIPEAWRQRSLRSALRRNSTRGADAELAARIAGGAGLAVVRTVEGASRRRAIAAAADAVAGAGGEVWGLGPDNASLDAFQGIGRKRRMTVQHFLQSLTEGRIRLTRESVAIVAGAGALQNQTLLDLVKAASEAGFRLALTEDARLAPGVGRSEAWRWLADRHDPDGGHTAAALPEHLPERDRDALQMATSGDWGGAMAKLEASDGVRILADREAVHAAIASAWTGRRDRGISMAIAANAAEAAALNATIQAARREAGRLGRSAEFTVRDPGSPDGGAALRLHEGDRVRIRRRIGRGALAGAIGTVRSVHPKRLAIEVGGRTVALDAREPLPVELGYAVSARAARHQVFDRVHVAVAPQWGTRELWTAMSRHRERVTLYARAEHAPDARAIGTLAARGRAPAFSQARSARWEVLEAGAPGTAAESLREAWRHLPEAEREAIEEQDRRTREIAGEAARQHEDPVEAWAANNNRQDAYQSLVAGIRDMRTTARLQAPLAAHASQTQEIEARWRAIRREAREAGTALREHRAYPEIAGGIEALGRTAERMLREGPSLAPALRAHGGGLAVGDLARQVEEARREQQAAASWSAGGEERAVQALVDAWKEAREESLDRHARLRSEARRSHRRVFFAEGYGEWIESVRELDGIAERLQASGALAEERLAAQGGVAALGKAREEFARRLRTDAREREAAEKAAGYGALGDGERRNAAREMAANLRFWGPHLRAAGVDPGEVAALVRPARQERPVEAARTRQRERRREHPRAAEAPPGYFEMEPARRREWVARLAQDLAGRAEDVARRVFPGGRRNGKYWEIGDLAGRPGDSLKVDLTGSRIGKWRDYATQEHGDLLDLFRMQQGGNELAAYREAAELVRTPLIESEAQIEERRQERRQRTEKELAEAARKEAAARKLWDQRKSVRNIAGTPVEAYLAGRGLRNAGRFASLRYHPSAWLNVDLKTRHELPAMFAAVADNAGEVRALHRTYLGRREDGGWGKTDVTKDVRRTLGGMKGNGVRLGEVGENGILVAGEGLETTLSVLEVRPDLAGVSCAAASHLAAFDPPENVRTMLIATDADDAGRRAASELRQRCEARGIRAIVAEPPEGRKDWNDALVELGGERTRQAVALALGETQAQTVRPEVEKTEERKEVREVRGAVVPREPAVETRTREGPAALAGAPGRPETVAGGKAPESAKAEVRTPPAFAETATVEAKPKSGTPETEPEVRKSAPEAPGPVRKEAPVQGPPATVAERDPPSLEQAVEKFVPAYLEYRDAVFELAGRIGKPYNNENERYTLALERRVKEMEPGLYVLAKPVLKDREQAEPLLARHSISYDIIKNSSQRSLYPEYRRAQERKRQAALSPEHARSPRPESPEELAAAVKEYVEGHGRFVELLNESAWKLFANRTGKYTESLAEIEAKMDDLAPRLDRLSGRLIDNREAVDPLLEQHTLSCDLVARDRSKLYRAHLDGYPSPKRDRRRQRGRGRYWSLS